MAIPIERMLGVLRIIVKRGIDLAVRDVTTSDPYVVITLGHQKVKTEVIQKSVNPEWDEKLTLYASDPHVPLHLNVYDKDMMFDDKLGDAEVDMRPFLESIKMMEVGMEDGTIIQMVHPGRENCLIETSNVVCMEGKVTQNMFLRLRNVEQGEIELEMKWIDADSFRHI